MYFVLFPIGLLYGGISGYMGGKTAIIMMRFAEAVMSIPSFYLLIILASILPSGMTSVQRFMLIVLILEWTTRKQEHPLQLPIDGVFRYSAVRYALYAGISLLLFIYAGEVETFIYFKF